MNSPAAPQLSPAPETLPHDLPADPQQPTPGDCTLRIANPAHDPATAAEALIGREWLVANGLGGYASGTIGGVATRRYHSLLIAALPAPLGRRVMLNHLSELIRLPSGRLERIGGTELRNAVELYGTSVLTEFRLELGLPVWRYEIDGYIIEKRVFLPHQKNTVHISYHLLQGDGPVRIKLRPSLQLRPHDAPVSDAATGPYTLSVTGDRIEVQGTPHTPPLRLALHATRPAFTIETRELTDLRYRIEESRGYEAQGNLWSPGYFRADLSLDSDVTLVASTETWDDIQTLAPPVALAAEIERRKRLLTLANPSVRSGPASALVLAADQFIIRPAARTEDSARAHAAGAEARSVIAGYHWFTDWGRDTMISLEGLTLTTGRHAEAAHILRTFIRHVRDGLIPNLFPEGEKEGLYHTADATLWFFHALHRYERVAGDSTLVRELLPTLRDIIRHHQQGTRFNIGVDPADGLLHQGQLGYQLTWMDAKVGDWVVTPRRGKAVEINALWYNALRLLEHWVREIEGDAAAEEYAAAARQAYDSFNARFWYESGRHLYDVVDGESGDDPACRPNQVFAISLPHTILAPPRWEPVMQAVTDRLLTPVGLRSLAPGHPDYKPIYFGDLRARDAAYHQGTVWGWLIGPYLDAWFKLHPDDPARARDLLSGFVSHLSEACVGQISEVFDAEAPYFPRGCVAQAWSVAEVLRTWSRLGNEPSPG